MLIPRKHKNAVYYLYQRRIRWTDVVQMLLICDDLACKSYSCFQKTVGVKQEIFGLRSLTRWSVNWNHYMRILTL